MADDPDFQERFSALTNVLQIALNLTRERAIHARQDLETHDAAYQAVVRAVDAANQLRPNGDREQP